MQTPVRALLLLAVASFVLTGCSSSDNPSPTPVTQVFDITSLQSIDVTIGTGTEATLGRTLTVHYTGWLYSPTAAANKGTRFQSSRDSGQPFTFVLGAGTVIRGWDQGIPGMRVGGTRTLLIPSSLAYGTAGRDPIPGGQALVFDIELLTVQ